jgi:hypothetical protein
MADAFVVDIDLVNVQPSFGAGTIPFGRSRAVSSERKQRRWHGSEGHGYLLRTKSHGGVW